MSSVETYIRSNIDELLKECAHACKEPTVGVDILEDAVYEGCEYCLIVAALDHLNVPSVTVRTVTGDMLEFALVDNLVFEVAEGSVSVYPLDSLYEHLSDLIEFGVIDEESAEVVKEWLAGRSKSSRSGVGEYNA